MGDGGHVLGAQVLRGVGPLSSRDEGSFVIVKLDPPPFLDGVLLSRYTRHTYTHTPTI